MGGDGEQTSFGPVGKVWVIPALVERRKQSSVHPLAYSETPVGFRSFIEQFDTDRLAICAKFVAGKLSGGIHD